MIRVSGHTDERGSDEYNLALGQRRAAAAKAYLVQHGIAESRIETISYGEERPVGAGIRRRRLRAESPRRVRDYGGRPDAAQTMMRWSAVAPLVLVAASGCLATKSDIQLLQTEARTSRVAERGGSRRDLCAPTRFAADRSRSCPRRSID